MFGGLLAVLMGCNNSGSPFPEQESTFEVVQSEVQMPPVADPGPVVGTVTVVPDTDPKTPVTGDGKATPLGETKDDNGAILLGGLTDGPEKVGRFTEIAPDTIGGATFVSSPAYQYDLGKLVAMASRDSKTFSDGKVFITPIKGQLRYPEVAINDKDKVEDKFPVVVLLHGQHSSSVGNYQGYDYLAEDLATNGYVVLSIDANAINAEDVTRVPMMWSYVGGGDESSQSRAQLVLGTLDRLRQIDGFGQIDLEGNRGKLDLLKGKLDFSRIGIMGHSRGGQGISNTILFNKTRRGVTEQNLIDALKADPAAFDAFPTLVVKAATATLPARIDKKVIKNLNLFYAAGETKDIYDFKGAFLLAPTDFGGNAELNDVPLATLLPSCDGDLTYLPGAMVYDHNRFGPETDTAPRYQIMVNGANHNYYNTIWTSDDFGSDRGPAFCKEAASDSIRLKDESLLTPGDAQRRSGQFIVNSFMRYHVGGEENFAPYWNAQAQLPNDTCPNRKGPCDERVILTVQQDQAHRKLIHRFDQASSMPRNALGGATTLSGFDESARCAMFNTGTADDCAPGRLEDFAFDASGFNGLRSVADHAELAWSKPDAAIVEDITGLSAKGFDSLTFRIAVVRPMGQEVMVTLTDSAGKTSTVTASDFSDALYNAPRRKQGGDLPREMDLPMKDADIDAPYASGQMRILLNMVAIPLKAFEGVDTTSLKELKLVFPKESGKVAITDIELQNLGREKAEQTVAAKQ